MRFGFYEKVKVAQSHNLPQYIGKVGVVTGISEDDNNVYGYTIYFLDGKENLFFRPHDLQGAGEFVDRSVLYDESDKVRVRIIKGRGQID